MSISRQGKKHWNWQGGKPKCLVCNKIVSGYGYERCSKHRHASEETKEKFRKSMIGKPPLKHNSGCDCFRCDKKVGEKNHNWKGGITPEVMRIRRSKEYKQWVNTVFQRDQYTCQACKKRGGDLHAHHIKRFADYPDLRFELSNGQTLCVPCHRKTFSAKIKS